MVFPGKRTDIQKLLVRDQFLLVLMRLRGVKDLAFRFSLSKQSVSELFSAGLATCFVSWDSCPGGLTGTYSLTTCLLTSRSFLRSLAIIDCTEIKTETLSSLKVQSQCYSGYKSSTTPKSLQCCCWSNGCAYVCLGFIFRIHI